MNLHNTEDQRQTQDKGYADVDYLKTAAGLFRPIKERSYALLRIEPGARLLDVGCGPGTDTLALGQRVGAQGSVVGIDHDAAMVALAAQRAAEAGLTQVRHEHGSATALPFPDDAFDGCRAERVFIHLPEPARVLAEMVRVTQPGGWVVAVDTDFATLSFDTDDSDTERQLVRLRAEQLFHNGYAGRRLYRLFKQAGLVEVTLEMMPLALHDSQLMRYLAGLAEAEQAAVARGLLSEAQVSQFQTALAQADQAGCFFGSASVMLVAGRKPAA